MTHTKRLAVVEVTRFRPRAADYHAYVERLNARVAQSAGAFSWDATRIASADVGTAALLSLTDKADAIMIMGGEDLAPARYDGASSYPHQGQHFETADEAQIALVRRAVVRGTPLLGICRGLQVINVALGGTLIQDLGDSTIHKNAGAPVEQLMHAHDVELVEGSRVARWLGSTTALVQSAHHQAVDRLGSELRVTGWAPDGVVEVIEHATAPIMGVQFHPEDRGAPAGQLARFLDGHLAQSSAAPVESGRVPELLAR